MGSRCKEKSLRRFFLKICMFAGMKRGISRAIVIGINYTGETYALPDCEQDADMMAAMLESRGVEVHLQKGECSVSWLLSHLTITAATRQRPEDTLYIYFSGHGTQYPDASEPNGIGEALCFYNRKSRIIPLLKDNDLVAALDRIPGTKIVILDSCFSGGMNREAVEPIEGMQKKYLAFDPHTMPLFESIATRDVLRYTPQYFLFACSEEQVSYSTGNGGAFTLALHRCLQLGYCSLSKILKWTKPVLSNYGQTSTAHVVGGSYSKKII